MSSAEIIMDVPMQRVFQVKAVPLPEDASAPPRFLVVLQEVTASRNAQNIRADFVANVSHELRSPPAAGIEQGWGTRFNPYRPWLRLRY